MSPSNGIAASGMCSCCARPPNPLASPSTAIAIAITASSTGAGTRFRIRVPRADSASSDPAAPPKVAAGRIFNRIALPCALGQGPRDESRRDRRPPGGPGPWGPGACPRGGGVLPGLAGPWPARAARGGCQPRGRQGVGSLARRGLQGERDGVDAPALIGRDRVALALEHVAKVGVADRAPDLGTHHAQRAILDQRHSVVAGWLVEARPATVGLELLRRAEQFGTARTTPVHALGLGVGVLTGPRRLGARFPEYLVLIRGKHFAPLRLGSLDLVHVAETTSPGNRYRGRRPTPRRASWSGLTSPPIGSGRVMCSR